MDINILFNWCVNNVVLNLRMASEGVHKSVLEDLGGDPGSPPAVAHRPAQWRRPDDGGGHEVRLPHPPHGRLLDDRGAPTSHHFHDPDG